ncbi:hypothetical protein AF35_00238 [Enterobacter roggenkampii CHS 79]|uniref:hypothetical protein n=1 Tax=Enterobacter cloacae complex TaxID=354276 RepID=UPI00049FD33E|nr:MULTISPECIES: hypothetical protein [Enterobacter cloacae complex]KDF60118.1 hypothetical protein AF35_00238 [Enterobacter roggenkampii CHS 79]
MNDSLNNKELVAVGHQFAKAMSTDTPIIDMAKIVSRLAERLDCTTAALREMTKQRDALATVNAVQDDHINQQADRIESLENTNAGLGKTLGAAQKRIAELETRALKVTFQRMPLDEMGSHRDGKKYSPSFGAGYNCAMIHCESEIREACAAAGISNKGE